MRYLLSIWMLLLAGGVAAEPEDSLEAVSKPATLVLQKNIKGKLSPKSVVASGKGLFFAQNMMYRHTINVYNRNYELVRIINDRVKLSDYGFDAYGENAYRGAPVEAAFSKDGKYCWVSNYQMYGDSTTKPGCDNCAISKSYDKSFVYKINTQTFEIEQIVEVGCVPKYIAVTPDGSKVLVSNWSSGDLSVIDVQKGVETERVKLGRYPRGIVVDAASRYAYVALMGSDRIAVVDLQSYEKDWIYNVGKAPRHLCMDRTGKYLYASINNERRVLKIDIARKQIIASAKTAGAPRSMELSGNNAYLYVVCYSGQKVQKINALNMQVVESVATDAKPIGITVDVYTNEVWVACYSGSLMVFKDTQLGSFAANRRPIAFGLTKYMTEDGFPEYQWGCFNANGYVAYRKTDELPDAPEITIPLTAVDTEIPVLQQLVPAEEEEQEAPIPQEPKEVDVVLPKTPSVTSAPEQAENYYIIAGSFTVAANAEKMKAQLQTEGYKAQVITRKSGSYLVTYGSYQSNEAAQSALPSIKRNGNPKAWVYKRK